jgi:tripartite-type tricarboxylate transporter receptor subunit TctC
MPLRKFARWLALLLLVGPAQAQEFPTRPISMVVSAAAGGPIDVFGRILAERMGEILGQRVIIENIAGAGGMTGGQHVARAQPDGYTILLGTIATHAHSQLLYRKPLYNAVTDFTPVALVAELPLMNYGSAGAGSATHLGCMLLNAGMGTSVTHVPYRGTGPAMQDLRAGNIDFLCEIIVTAIPQIQGGAVKALATLSGERTPVLPDLPTAVENGLQVQAYSWTAIFLPKGTPETIVAKLHKATVEAMETPAVREKLQAFGSIIVGPERRSPEYLAGFVKSEIDKWAEPIGTSGAVIGD